MLLAGQVRKISYPPVAQRVITTYLYYRRKPLLLLFCSLAFVTKVKQRLPDRNNFYVYELDTNVIEDFKNLRKKDGDVFEVRVNEHRREKTNNLGSDQV